MKRLVTTSAILFLTAAALSGCSSAGDTQSSGGDSSDSAQSTPLPLEIGVSPAEGDLFTPNGENGVRLVMKDGKEAGFEVLIGGSGSATPGCAPFIDHIEGSETEITVVLQAPPTGTIACTDDLRAYNFVVTYSDMEKIQQVNLDPNGSGVKEQTFTREEFFPPVS